MYFMNTGTNFSKYKQRTTLLMFIYDWDMIMQNRIKFNRIVATCIHNALYILFCKINFSIHFHLPDITQIKQTITMKVTHLERWDTWMPNPRLSKIMYGDLLSNELPTAFNHFENFAFYETQNHGMWTSWGWLNTTHPLNSEYFHYLLMEPRGS
jgi:hypothetical protein